MATAGFTLVETLIALLLALIGFALASQLLLESQQALVAGEREANNPLVQLTSRLLRHDVQKAVAVGSTAPPGLDIDLSTPLVLTARDGGSIIYGRGNWGPPTSTLASPPASDLLRLHVEPDGELRSRRRMLLGVETWNWHLLTQDLIEVTLVHREHAGPRPARARPRPEAPRLRASQLRLGLRGGSREDRW